VAFLGGGSGRAPGLEPAGLVGQVPIAEGLDGGAVATVAQGGAHGIVALRSGAHELEHGLGVYRGASSGGTCLEASVRSSAPLCTGVRGETVWKL
jgi:hypothetical protein